MSARTVLSFGAGGPIGGLVVPEFARRGMSVRAFIHLSDREQAVRDDGATDVVIGDMSDEASVAAALNGADAVFYIAPLALADQAAVGRRIVEQAQAAGVRRFVFSSVIHPILDLPNHRGKAPVEDALVSSAMEYTILHPSVLYQNYAGAWDAIRKTGVLAEPWSIETRHSRVDYRDVAEVAAIALAEDRLVDGTFELCAPGALDRNDVAALASQVLGRSVSARRIDPATLPEPSPIRAMAEHYDHHGLRGSPLTLRAILDREPRTLLSYFEALQEAGADRGR